MIPALIVVSAPPLPLVISLLFGVGQCLVGAALLARGLSAGRWRRASLYVTAILGAWLICSGVAELLVSGSAFAAIAPATLAGVRRVADTGLLIATAVLTLALLLYPLAAPHRIRDWLRRLAPDRAREE